MNWSEVGIDISKVRGSSDGKTICPKCTPTRKNKHDRSLSVNIPKGVWNCHNCGWTGTVNTTKKVEKIYQVPEWQNNTSLSEKLVKWFSDRGISQQTLIKAKIGEGLEWMPSENKEVNTIKFPYFQNGNIVNIKYRTARKGFKLAKGAKLIFCNIDSIKDSDYAIITEGEMDMLSYIEIGQTPVISVPNGASMGAQLEYLDNTIDLFASIKTIYLALDDDEPGRALRDELARRLGYHRCRKVLFNGFKDANELLKADRLALEETISQAAEYPVEGLYTADDIWGDVLRIRKEGLKPGKNTTILQINELITFEPGYSTIVTGIPNHGKSEVVDQITVDLNVLHKWRVGIYSPENYPLELHFSKIASKITGIPFNDMDEATLEKCRQYFNENFFFIMPDSDLSVNNILDKATYLVKKHGIKILIIDAWNKLEHQYSGNETQYISKQLDLLDVFCRVNNVHLFLVAHPTKIKKDKDGNYEVPSLYDISGSANFYNKPANGLSVYRRFFPDGSSNTEIYVQKVKFKHWGRQGMCSLRYDLPSGRYYNLTPNKSNFLDDANVKPYLYTPAQPIPATPEVKDYNELSKDDDDETPF